MDKKILLVALNAKYSHTSLAVRSIAAYVKKYLDYEVPYVEFTINDEYFFLLNEILKRKPKIIGFACYIWNIELVKKLCEDIKSINPSVEIFLGGPEVSYNENIFDEIKSADFVIKGEGEIPVKEFIEGKTNIKGIWRKGEEASFSEMADLDSIPFPYTSEELSTLENRAVYYETSRGCPFKCAFCLSSLTKGVRTLSLDRVFKEIDIFIKAGIKRVKLVDRTFNFDKKRAKAIVEYILMNSKDTCFHFEIGADLLDDELICMINSAKKDVIQFEAGIQSTNEKTLDLCHRSTDMNKLKNNLLGLTGSEIRIHLDLIAGLPEEDYESFKKSFNEGMALKPKVMQVGFLKLLHGSELRAEKEKYGYKFRCTAPYEVLSNKFISFEELMEIKKVEKATEIYHNSGMFKNTLSELPQNISLFDFYHKLGENVGNDNLSLKDKFRILLETLKDSEFWDDKYEELLKFDYVLKQRGVLPGFFKNLKTNRHITEFNEFINNEENIFKYLPWLSDIKPRDIIKRVDFDVFIFNGKETVMLFDRESGKVTALTTNAVSNL